VSLCVFRAPLQPEYIPKRNKRFFTYRGGKRQYIIKNNFEKFGFFQPIETPSFENSETFNGKYGEEGDRLILKF
jgi:histidyl-tRNA synthetase